MSTGSSPLARGLPAAVCVDCCRTGIIPARAGFTGFRRLRTGRLADHPRSRGVYRDGRGGDRAAGGSSPLARGLRAHRALTTTGHGIIPARAGFTYLLSSITKKIQDHPRSRGVYALRHVLGLGGQGSSPLARGLRTSRPRRYRRYRIIPARAGFTPGAESTDALTQDHPRSRGVYPRWRPIAPMPVGSSPLARGLLLRAIRS